MNISLQIKNLTLCALLFSVVLISNDSFAHSWMAPSNEANKQNPIDLIPESIELGKNIYKINCASCHGKHGKGLSKEITGLNNDTPNLTQRLKTHSDGDFHWKIRKGRNEMPSFENSLSDIQIWNVINHIKQLE